jgi:hypothetical protein
MSRKPSPDQEFGPGASVWATLDARDLLFDLAKAEERSVKVVLRRALHDYAARSEDFQAWLKLQKQRPKAA